MKTSNILLVVGLFILLVGAILRLCDLAPYSDYVLIAGALVILIRGAVRSREKDDSTHSTSEHYGQSDDH